MKDEIKEVIQMIRDNQRRLQKTLEILEEEARMDETLGNLFAKLYRDMLREEQKLSHLT